MRITFMKKLLMIAIIPCLVVCICMCILAANNLERNMTTEVSETLRATAYSLAYDDTQDCLNGYKSTLDIDVTVFHGDERTVTTVPGSVGTKADPSIYATVRSGKEYFSTNANVNGKEYFGYYIPLYDSEQAFVGMSFAGKPTEKVQTVIGGTILKMIGSAIVIIGLVLAVVIIIAQYMKMLMNML